MSEKGLSELPFTSRHSPTRSRKLNARKIAAVIGITWPLRLSCSNVYSAATWNQLSGYLPTNGGPSAGISSVETKETPRKPHFGASRSLWTAIRLTLFSDTRGAYCGFAVLTFLYSVACLGNDAGTILFLSTTNEL